jgi:tetratricopeptide (TPR) repeat protein
LVEACWLAAVVVVPLAYNPHGIAAFQPFKMAIVRLLAAVLVAAWVVRRIEGGPSADRPRATPLVIVLWAAVGLLALAHVVAGVFSVDQALSHLGFSPNREGLVSFFAGLVFFAAVARHLRSPAQRERLTAAIILPTIPLALFAIAQSCGFDPLNLDQSALEKDRGAVSLAGHQISLAAHLGMVIPFTLLRLYETWRAAAGARLFHGAVLLLQLTAVLLSKSRGPLLALLAGVVVMIVASAAFGTSRRVLRWGGLAAIGVVVFLATLSIPAGPVAPLARLPVLDRLAQAVPVGQAPDPFRTSLWASAPRLLLAEAPFVFPDGHSDLPPRTRAAIGFGPETLQGVLPRTWSWIDPERRLEKSFHNLFWDSWFSLGLIGVGAHLVALAAGILLAFRALDFRAGWKNAAFGGLAGILIAGGLVARFGPGYLGLGVQAGLAGGLAAAFAGFVVFSPRSMAPQPALGSALVIAAGAALVSHLVETAFAFQVAATSLLFWIGLGIVVAGSRWANEPLLVAEPAQPWALPVLAALAACALGFAFVHLDFLAPQSWWETLTISLTRITSTNAASHLLPLVILPSLVLLAALAGAESERSGGRFWPAWRRTLLAAGMLGGAYVLFKASQLAAAGPLPGADTPVAEIFRQARCAEWMVLGFFSVIGLLLALLARACAPDRTTGAVLGSRIGLVAAALLVAGFFTAAYPLTLRFVLGDTAFASASLRATSPHPGTRQAGIEVLARAIGHDPWAYEYRLRFSDACVNLAGETDARSGDALLARAVGVLTEGHALSPLNPLSCALARLHLMWALAEQRPGVREEHAREAARQFREALHFDPSADHLSVEHAAILGGLLNEPEAATAALRRAESLVAPGSAKLWAEAFAKWSVHATHPLLRQRYAERGIFHYGQALQLAARENQPASGLHVGKGTLLRNQGRLAEALTEFRLAAAGEPASGNWRTQAMLAHTLGDLGDKAVAREHVARAIEGAPAEFQDALRELQAQLVKP